MCERKKKQAEGKKWGEGATYETMGRNAINSIRRDNEGSVKPVYLSMSSKPKQTKLNESLQRWRNITDGICQPSGSTEIRKTIRLLDFLLVFSQRILQCNQLILMSCNEMTKKGGNEIKIRKWALNTPTWCMSLFRLYRQEWDSEFLLLSFFRGGVLCEWKRSTD